MLCGHTPSVAYVHTSINFGAVIVRVAGITNIICKDSPVW